MGAQAQKDQADYIKQMEQQDSAMFAQQNEQDQKRLVTRREFD